MTNEEAIKRIHRFVETYKICGKDNYNPATNITKLDYEAFKTAIESLEQMESISNKSEILTGWIPVSERLPKTDGTYLTYIRNPYDSHISYIMICDYIRPKWFPVDETASSNVVAWMPLPEPYRESEE